MVFLKIIAFIPSGKMIEFSQTKKEFFQDIQRMDGYVSFTENYGMKDYQLLIEWKNKSSFKEFQGSDIYNIFHGALVTLGELRKITISTDLKTLN